MKQSWLFVVCLSAFPNNTQRLQVWQGWDRECACPYLGFLSKFADRRKHRPNGAGRGYGFVKVYRWACLHSVGKKKRSGRKVSLTLLVHLGRPLVCLFCFVLLLLVFFVVV